jgi:hypothetical protein
MPQRAGKHVSEHNRRSRDSQFKESGIIACGILAASLIRNGESGSSFYPSTPPRSHLARGPSQRACDGGIVPAMLPGIRFLLAAVLLATSILVFGLGAAALLRAAHEDFTSNPSWRATPETRFAQSEAPTLALLRVEAPAPAARPADVPMAIAPETSATAGTPAAAPSEDVAAVSPGPVPEKPAIPAVTSSTPSTETAKADDAAKTEAAPAPTPQSSEPTPAAVASEAPPAIDQPNTADATQNKPEAIQDTKLVATEAGDTPPKTSDTAPSMFETVKPAAADSGPAKGDAAAPEIAKPESASTDAARPEQATAAAPPETPAIRIVKLDKPAVKIEEPSLAKAEAKKAAEKEAEKEKARGEKARARRRLAARRARAARLAAAQRAADPFQLITPTAPAPARTP